MGAAILRDVTKEWVAEGQVPVALHELQFFFRATWLLSPPARVRGHGLIIVRNLRADEEMPQHLGTGYEKMPVMKDFVWIAEEAGKIIGTLMAAPCHGVVFLVRLRAEAGASAMTVPLMFRRFVKDCVARGFQGYFTFIDPTIDAERRFIPICGKAGGFQVPALQVALVGKLDQAARY